MNKKKKLSLTYRFLRVIGMHYSEEEYGQVSAWEVVKKVFANYYHALLQSMMDWVIFAPIAHRKLRPWLLRRMGAKVGKGVFIGDHVAFDLNHSDLIFIDDVAHITGGCRLLCHQRDLKGYCVGDNAAELPYRLGDIHIGKGVMIGMMSLIMPGTKIGDGAIVGAYSLITKDIPPYTIATGRPAKVIKEIAKCED